MCRKTHTPSHISTLRKKYFTELLCPAYRNVNRLNFYSCVCGIKNRLSDSFRKNDISSAAKIRKSVRNFLKTLFFAGKMALWSKSKYCRDKTDKTPKNSGQNFKVNNCITVRFGKNEITMNQKNYKKKPPRRMLNPKCPKRKKSLSTLYRFYLLISAFYGFWVTLTGPAVYNGI